MFGEEKRAKWDIRNKRKGRWGAGCARLQLLLCLRGTAVPAERRLLVQECRSNNLSLRPREGVGAAEHVADTLNSRRGLLHLGLSQEWPTCLLVSTLPDAPKERGGEPWSIPCLPFSPPFPHREEWEHTDICCTCTHRHTHTPTCQAPQHFKALVN